MPWVKGKSGNPAGRPVGIFHNYMAVAEGLLESFSVSELKAMASNHDLATERGLKPFQIAVLGRISNLFDTIDKRLASDEMERLLDRTIGKPLSKTELTGKDGERLQINVVTGVPAIDAEFSEVIGVDAPRNDDDSVAVLPAPSGESDG